MEDTDRKKRKRVYDESDNSDSSSSSASESNSSSSSDSDSESSGSHKKKKKKVKKEKAKKDKKKKSKGSKAEKKRLKEAKKLLKRARTSTTGQNSNSTSGGAPGESRTQISSDDYFQKADEFRVWLQREKGLFLGDMKTDQARKYFKKFVKKWNGNELGNDYYDGLDHTRFDSAQMTRHKWGFTRNLSSHEKFNLQTMRDSVDTDTFHKSSEKRAAERDRLIPTGPQLPVRPQDPATRDERRALDAKILKAERKAFRGDQKVIEEELVPKETGREAMLEKRRAKGAYARQENDTMPEMNDRDIMGGDSRSDFRQMIQARDNRTARVAIEKSARATELIAKEKGKMDALLKSLNLDPNTYR
jgi:hypothetical protein